MQNHDDAASILALCSKDVVFWLDTFAYTYDPRVEGGKMLPFILWQIQEKAIGRLESAVVGGRNILVEKSRDMGASWLCLSLFVHRWLFRPMETFLMVSRKEELVDDAADPKSLFWKVDFLLKYLPAWMVPEHKRTFSHLLNIGTGATIDGESTNQDVGRGDRRTAILLDEFAAVENGYEILAATKDATRCRIFNSTPKGVGNAFYFQRDKCEILRLHWTDHPEKGRGQYIKDGKIRSPAYDKEAAERPAQELAQEWDIDYAGSGFAFFDLDALAVIQKRDMLPPCAVGRLSYGETGRPGDFLVDEHGDMRLWMHLDSRGCPPESAYCIGIDVAAGTGASNSTAIVIDSWLCKIVAELANPSVRPDEWASQCLALARWLDPMIGAYMIWESFGPGRQFGDRIVELGYRNIYYRTDDQSLAHKQSDTPGWSPTPGNKLAVLGELRRALGAELTAHSKHLYEEATEYVFYQGAQGCIEHSRAATAHDPSGAGANHGDRVIGAALAWKIAKERYKAGKVPEVVKPEEYPENSIGWRREQRRREALEAVSW